MGAPENIQNIQTEQLRTAMEQVAHKQNRDKVTRRALLGAAGVGAVAGAVVLVPIAIETAANYTKQEVDQALQNGIAQGRQDLLAELRSLEGVGLDTAIAVAKITKFAVQYIVKPLADLSSTIQGDVIGVLVGAVEKARVGLIDFPIPIVPSSVISTLGHLQELLQTWQHNVSQDVLGQYAVEDVTAAETYLEALQQKINSESAQGTPTPGKASPAT